MNLSTNCFSGYEVKQQPDKSILHHVKSLFDSISEYLSVNKFFIF